MEGYLNNMDSEWIFQVDSDNEMSASDFFQLWNVRHNYDLIIGSRTKRQSSLIRKITTLMSRIIVILLYGILVHDVNVPYRLMRCTFWREIIKNIPKHYLTPNIIIAGLAAIKRARTVNIPVTYKNRQFGEVSIKRFKLIKFAFKSFWQVIWFRLKSYV